MATANMALNRRGFLKLSATGAAVAFIPATLAIEGCSTNWVQVVLNDLPTVIQIVNSIVSVVATASGNGALAATVAAELTVASQTAQASLQAFQDAVNAYNASKTQGNLSAVIAALNAVQADLQKVIAALPAGTVSTNVETVIVAAIGVAITTLSSIQLLIPGAAPAQVRAKAATAVATEKITMPSASALKAAVRAVYELHGYANALP